MTCRDCPYLWKAEGEEFSRCHYEGPDNYAPCEEDDYIEEDD